MIWNQVVLWLGLYTVEILLVLGAMCLGLVFFCLYLLTAIRSLKKRYLLLMQGHGDVNIEELLNHYGGMISGCLEKQKAFELRLAEIERQLALSITGVGLVRFNAFQETGGDLSFSLALLDSHENGVVLTSIFGREDSRFYGKPVREGQSTYLLSEEEKQALAEARQRMAL